jgi:hypothetical protein
MVRNLRMLRYCLDSMFVLSAFRGTRPVGVSLSLILLCYIAHMI